MAAQAAKDRQESIFLKQRDALNKDVSDLLTVGFTEFKFEMDHVAEDYGWHQAILNTDLTAMPDPDLDDLDGQERGHIRQLYNLLINKCKTHKDVYSQIKQVPVGPWRGRHAWIAVTSYFRKQTQGGLDDAQDNFNGATMANQNCSIALWTAKVLELGQILRDVGGQCNEARETTLLLKGLLQEFKPCKTIITLGGDRSWTHAKTTLLNFASNEKITDLTKAGGGANHHQTFTVTTESTGQQACRNWMTKGGCRYGTSCNRSHAAPGGKHHALCRLNPGKIISIKDILAFNEKQPGHSDSRTRRPPAQQLAAQLPPYPAVEEKQVPTCHFCLGDNHAMCDCPLYKKSQVPAQTFAAATIQPNYTFTGEAMDDGHDEPAPTSTGTTSKFCSMLYGFLFMLIIATPAMAGRYFARAGEAAAQNPFAITALSATIFLASYGAFAMPSGSGTEHSCSFPPATTFVLENKQVRTSKIEASTYNMDDKLAAIDTSHFEWCSDSGTNRFVTNDANDFVSGTVKQHATTVAVGGGEYQLALLR